MSFFVMYFLKGVLIGFSIAAPVGPIGVHCIRRTLQDGKIAGIFSGLGAALADTLYGIIGAFGISFISSFLSGNIFWFRLVGGVFLLYLGMTTFFAPIFKDPIPNKSLSKLKDFSLTFFLTLTNPMTIFSYAAIVAAIGLTSESGNQDIKNAAGIVTGIFFGSMLWWIALAEGVFLLKKKTHWMDIVNKIAGIIIFLFGVSTILSLT